MLYDIFYGVVVQPLFNLLVFIYALLPGHNFGLAIIIFTIIVRLCLWPILKRQLHHTKAIRKMQPELKRIKKQTAGDRQKMQLMTMELYKEKGISPFGPLGPLVLQFIVLIGLFVGLNHVIKDPKELIDNSYAFIRGLDWMQVLAKDIHLFDQSLFGFMDLIRPAIGNNNDIYWPALALVFASAGIQYLQSAQLAPKGDGRSMRQLFKDTAAGKSADPAEANAEMNEAIARNMKYFIPALVIIFTLKLAAALSLYWVIGGIVGYIQQSRILKQDEDEMEQMADAPDNRTKRDISKIAEAEVVESPSKTPKNKKSKNASKNKKRRKK